MIEKFEAFQNEPINERQSLDKAIVDFGGIKSRIELKPIGAEPFSPMKLFIWSESGKPFTESDVESISDALKKMNSKINIKKGSSKRWPSGLTEYTNLIVDHPDLNRLMLQGTLEKVLGIKNPKIV